MARMSKGALIFEECKARENMAYAQGGIIRIIVTGVGWYLLPLVKAADAFSSIEKQMRKGGV